MLNRKIPSTGESLPSIGIGSWIQFDVAGDSSQKNELAEVLHLLHQGGGKLIDSSPMYGQSEARIGELTSAMDCANEYFYATKVWTSGKEAGIQQMNASFLKLKRPVIDLMQIHNLVDWQTHLHTLRQWQEEARIRYLGITHYTTASHTDLANIIRQEPIDFVQFNYSIATRDAEKTLLPLAAQSGVAVIINEPLEKGRLFETVKGLDLPPWSVEAGISDWAGFFLKYAVSHPAVTCIIPATSDPGHIKQNLAAGIGTIPDEAMRKKMAAYFDSL